MNYGILRKLISRSVFSILHFSFFIFLAGCAHDDHPIPVPCGEVTVSATVEGLATRTSADGTAFAGNDEIGVFMLSSGGSLPTDILTVGGMTADNRKFIPNGTQFVPDAGQTIYYPTTGTVDFVAYYPHKPTGTGAGELNGYVYPVDVRDQGDPAAIDLLYSDDAAGKSRSGSPVSMNFVHKLSKLTLNVRKGDGMGSADFSTLTATLKGLPATAGFSLSTAGYSNEGTAPAAGFAARKITTVSGYEATFEAILIPQPGGGTGRTAVFAVGGEDFTWSIPDNAGAPFISGSNHTWTVTIGRTGVTASAGNITPWAATNDNPTTGTAEQVTVVAEANSYMVEPNGGAILIPVSQANRVLTTDGLGAATTGLGGVEEENFTVELVWGDTPVGATGVLKEIKAYDEFVYVKPGAAGNAVVAIRDKVSGAIKWSWHIWVTEPVASKTDTETGLTWMDRNLGAKSNTPLVGGVFDQAQWAKTLGLYWQWGRKDAFPGYNNQIYYTGSSTTPTTADPPTGSYTTLPGMVQNPLTFARNYETYLGSLNVVGGDNKSWGGVSGAKTLYDPCPPGWRVPEIGKWSSSNNIIINGSNDEWAAFANNGRVFNGVNGTSQLGHFYPAIGAYWSATPSSFTLYSAAFGYYMSFDSSSVTLQDTLFRTLGFAVRCVAE